MPTASSRKSRLPSDLTVEGFDRRRPALGRGRRTPFDREFTFGRVRDRVLATVSLRLLSTPHAARDYCNRRTLVRLVLGWRIGA